MTIRVDKGDEGVIIRELFAYLPDRNIWVYQGYVDDKNWIKRIKGQLAQFKNGFYEAFRQDNAYFDGEILAREWGVTMQPLPEGWQDALVQPEEYLRYIKRWEQEKWQFRENHSWPFTNPFSGEG